MLSKQNQILKQAHVAPHSTRFALRKLSVGLVSVAIGAFITVAFPSYGHAATAAPTEVNAPVTQVVPPTSQSLPQPNTPVTTVPVNNPDLAKQTIINDQNNSTAIPEANGLQHTLTITANGQSTTPGAGKAIINANELNPDGSFQVTFSAANTSQEAQRVDQIITLPAWDYYNRHATADPNQVNPVIDGRQLATTGPQLTYNHGDATQANGQILYATVPGQMLPLATLQATPGFTWDKIIEIQIITNLLPGQSYTMTVPMQIANLDQMKQQLATLLTHPTRSAISNASLRLMTFGDLFYYWNAQGQFFQVPANWQTIRLGVPDLTLTDALLHNANGTYNAQTLVKQGDHFTYSPIPAAIQALMPHVNSNDIHLMNFNNGQDAPVLFTDGSFTINTAPIFAALKNAGYATNIFPDGTALWPYYIYNATGHLDVTFTGNDSSQQPAIHLNPYVQVQQIFNPKDITIPVGSRWDQTDNLKTAPIIEYTDRTTMSLTGNPTLTFNQAGGFNTYQVDISQLPTAMENGHLVVTKPGIYPVIFSHHINAQDVVTATAYVTVTDTRVYTRTITYVNQAGQTVAPSVTQTISYLGTPQANGTIVWTPVVPGDTAFPLVVSPLVTNMTPDQTQVATQPIITSGDNATPLVTNVQVVYSPNLTTTTTTKTITRTIHYVNAQGQTVAPTVVQSVTVTGTTITNQLTGQSQTTWTQGNFPGVTSPVITGLTPDQTAVPDLPVTAQTNDQVITIIYQGNQNQPTPPAGSEQPTPPVNPGTPGNPNPTTPPAGSENPTPPVKPGTPENPNPTTPPAGNEQPTSPINPGTPTGPKPVTPPTLPGAVNHPSLDQPLVPNLAPGQPTISRSTPVLVPNARIKHPVADHSQPKKLPQTGNAHPAAISALGLLGLTTSLALLSGKKDRR